MRIAYLIDVIYPFIKGGSEKRVHDISKRLAGKHDVNIYGMRWWRGKGCVEIDSVKIHGGARGLRLYNRKGRRSLTCAIYYAFKLLSILGQKFDIIDAYIFPYIHCFPGKLNSMSRKTPMLITWIEGPWIDYWYRYLGRLGFIGKKLENFVSHFPAMHIAESPYNVDLLLKLGVEKEKIRIVPSGVSFRDIQRIKPANFDLDVVYVGRLINTKRVDLFIETMALLNDISQSTTAGIVGDGPERQSLEHLAKRLGVSKNITFFGRVEKDSDVMAIMKSSKVFLSPTAPLGGWCLTVLEAFSTGLPVVIVKQSELGRATDMVENGHTGLIVNAHSPELMAQKVSRILSEDSLRKTMSWNAQNFASRYDWSTITGMTERVYREALQS